MANPASPFKPGDRVTGVFYGMRKDGTVDHTGPRSNIVFVLWDSGVTHFAFPESLTLVPEVSNG